MNVRPWKHYFTNNLSYKVVSLFVALILWVTILGRRDFVLNKNIELDLIIGQGKTLVSQTAEVVKVKVSGPRNALRQFLQNSMNNSLTLDLSGLPVGTSEVDIPSSRIELPIGVKLLGIKPDKIFVEIK